MKPFLIVPILLLCGTIARADQLAYLTKSQSDTALALIRHQPFLVTYCSQCDNNRVVLWQLSHAEAKPTDHDYRFYEIVIVARPLLRSTKPTPTDGIRERIDLDYVGDPTETPKSTTIDLAYAYVLFEGEWVCIGKHLRFP